MICGFFFQRYPNIVKSYNKLARVLLCFEEKYLEVWRAQTEQIIPNLLKSSLLAIDTTNDRLLVHSNPRFVFFASHFC